jgi:hypothetical protein
MYFEELDFITREHMITEFDIEEDSGKPYRSKELSTDGLNVFAGFMRKAITEGNDVSLIQDLSHPQYWMRSSSRQSAKGGTQTVTINRRYKAEQLGLTEFNTWYVRGLVKRLMEEGETHCQIYRAGTPKGNERYSCSCLEGENVPLDVVYKGHRARYWPFPNRSAFSIPSGPSCHHSVRRPRKI